MISTVSIIFITTASIISADIYDKWYEEFDYNAYMAGSDEEFQVFWNEDQDACTLEVGLAVQNHDGWVGFGISESGSAMLQSDIVMGWIDSQGQLVIEHSHGQCQHCRPTIFNDQSKVKPIEGMVADINGTITTFVRFERELFPEYTNGVSVKIGTTKVIWARGSVSPFGALNQHGSTESDRYIESMNLLQGESAEIPLPPDHLSTDVFMADVQVPDAETTYYCSILELPSPNETHHVIQIDPLIDEDNIGEVHHMLLYLCPERMLNKDHIGKGSVCDDMGHNMPGTYCRGGVLFFGWAIGGKEYYFPEDVGLEIGGDNDDLKYVLLETHYDNPGRKANITDSSGFRLHYTPTLRKHSAGIVQIGATTDRDGTFIPPGIERAVNYAHCFAGCMESGINGTGIGNGDAIYAIANTLHTHLLGRQVALRHIRDGKELRPIDINLAYDFDYQQMTPFAEPVEILPTDELLVECVYDSRYDKEGHPLTEMTWGGESTYEEMCISFLLVYPKPALATCLTQYRGFYNYSSGEWSGDLERFFDEAEDRGYWNGSLESYDVTMEGALEFYQDFATGNIFTDNDKGALRYQWCYDSDFDPLPANNEQIPVNRPDIEYTSFNDDNFYVCSAPEDDGGFDWNGWYVYVVASLIGVLLIILVIYVVMKFRRNSKKGTDYHRVLGTEQQNNYGATNTYDQQISMQSTKI